MYIYIIIYAHFLLFDFFFLSRRIGKLRITFETNTGKYCQFQSYPNYFHPVDNAKSLYQSPS